MTSDATNNSLLAALPEADRKLVLSTGLLVDIKQRFTFSAQAYLVSRKRHGV